MVDEVRRGRGRPRDADIDARVMTATLELLVEDGFAGTTIQAISRRSNVHGSAIYRRWPTRIELIEEAIFPGLDVAAVRPSGDLRRDLRRFLRSYVRTLGSPAARAAVPALLASYQAGRPRAMPRTGYAFRRARSFRTSSAPRPPDRSTRN